jgi:nitrogen PTS system EIIA component
MGEEDEGVEFLTVEEVARSLRVHERTVYRLLLRGGLRGTRVGRVWRIRRSAYEVFLSAGERLVDDR